MKKLLRLFTYKEVIVMAAIILLTISQVYIDLLIPDYMAKITEYLKSKNNNINELFKYGGFMLALDFFSLIVAIMIVVSSSKIEANYSASLRKALFSKVQDMSIEETNKISIASLITRTNNDTEHIEFFFLNGFRVLIHAPILAIGAFIKISDKDWHWGVASCISFCILIIVCSICFVMTKNCFKKIQLLYDSINNNIRERIIGIKTIRAYNAEHRHEKSFLDFNNRLTLERIFTGNVDAFLSPFLNVMLDIFGLLIYLIGMVLIMQVNNDDKISIFSDMVVYSQYILQLGIAFFMLIDVFIFLPQAVVSTKRITEVLDSESNIKNGNYLSEDKTDPEILFDHVYFKYPNGSDYILEDICFKAKKGETIAITGSTGCGKTTMINLIPRFYDVTHGTIKIDNVDVRKYDQKTLRNKIGYVPQKNKLISGTIALNVAYSSQDGVIDEEKVREAITIAKADSFINEFEKGLNRIITKNGSNISGGQRQRICIARAIYKNPKIILLDDAFSALDYKTDLEVRTELKKKFVDAIIIIVSQRINTICDADKIIVLDKGKISGIGSHKELKENNVVYQQILSSQFSEKEKNND